jgi:hypothetical protein
MVVFVLTFISVHLRKLLPLNMLTRCMAGSRLLALTTTVLVSCLWPACLKAQLTVPNASFWLEADSLGNTSGPIGSWSDQTANPITVSQADAGLQPLLVGGGVGGHSYVHFDGVDDVLMNFSVTASELFSYSASTTFLMIRPDPVTTTGHAVTPITWEQLSDPRSRFLVHSDWNSQIIYQQGYVDFDGSTSYANQPAGYHGEWHVLALTRAGDTASIRVDGVELPITGNLFSGNGITTSQVGQLFIGRHRDDPLGMDIAEMLIFPTALSNADVQSVEGYLQEKYLTAVPEPASTATVAGLVCCLGACFLRRRRRAELASAQGPGSQG